MVQRPWDTRTDHSSEEEEGGEEQEFQPESIADDVRDWINDMVDSRAEYHYYRSWVAEKYDLTEEQVDELQRYMVENCGVMAYLDNKWNQWISTLSPPPFDPSDFEDDAIEWLNHQPDCAATQGEFHAWLRDEYDFDWHQTESMEEYLKTFRAVWMWMDRKGLEWISTEEPDNDDVLSWG